MFNFLNDKYGLLLTQEELQSKKIKILAIFLIIIGIGFLYKNMVIYTTGKLINQSFSSMENMDKDSTYDFLYFDKSLNSEIRENYKDMLKLQPEIVDSLSKNKIRVFVSENDIQTSISKLSKIIKLPVTERTVGIFIKEYNLITLKYQNPRNFKTKLIKGTDNDKINELLNQNITNTTLGMIYDEKQLTQLDILTNKTVLYHEIGHYLDAYAKHKLDYNYGFYKAYLKEKDLLMSNEESYYKKNVSEYIAQSVSYSLIYGNVESKNNFVKPNTTETSKYIKNLIKEYKITEGGED